MKKNEKIEQIKTSIETMEKYHQIEILKILNNETDTVLNENKNGIFVNLTDMSPNIILKLENYINYYQHQQKNLTKIEEEKKEIENSFFKDNKDCFG